MRGKMMIDNLLLNSTPLSLPPKPDQLPLPSPEQPIFDIPAFTPIVPIKLRSKDSTQSLELLDKAAATHRALPTYITEPLAPLAPLEPLEMAYMRGEAGEGLVGCVRTEKKRKYAYDGEGICGEQVKQKAEGKEGKWTAVGDSAAGELQVTAALFKHVGSSYRPHGRAFDILVDKGAENGAVKTSPALPSPAQSPPPKLFNSDRRAKPSNEDLRALHSDNKALLRENSRLRHDLKEEKERVGRYNRRSLRSANEADTAEKERDAYKLSLEAETKKAALQEEAAQRLEDALVEAKKAAGQWEEIARTEQETCVKWRKEADGSSAALASLKAAHQHAQSSILINNQAETRLAETTLQLHALQATFAALPPVQNPLFPTHFDFTATRQALLAAKVETLKERNTAQELKKEVNRYISARAVWAEERGRLEDAKRKADEAREASLMSSGNKIAMLNDEHEKQFAEMQLQLELLEDMKAELDAKDVSVLEKEAAYKAVQQELLEVKAEAEQEGSRCEWYKKELAISQTAHATFKAELERVRAQIELITARIQSAQALISKDDRSDETSDSKSAAPNTARFRANETRSRSLEQVCADQKAEIALLRAKNVAMEGTNSDLNERWYAAKTKGFNLQAELDEIRRHTERRGPALHDRRGADDVSARRVPEYERRGIGDGMGAGRGSPPTGPRGNRQSLADRISWSNKRTVSAPMPIAIPRGRPASSKRGLMIKAEPRTPVGTALGRPRTAAQPARSPISTKISAAPTNPRVRPVGRDIEEGEIMETSSPSVRTPSAHQGSLSSASWTHTPSLTADESCDTIESDDTLVHSPLIGWNAAKLPLLGAPREGAGGENIGTKPQGKGDEGAAARADLWKAMSHGRAVETTVTDDADLLPSE